MSCQYLVCFREKLERFYNSNYQRHNIKSCNYFVSLAVQRLMKPISLELAYFLGLSLLGYLALKLCEPRSVVTDLDLFFTSVSSATVSSMSSVEMEVFSNAQLIIITLLMLLGGEVFVSMLALKLHRSTPEIVAADNQQQQEVELGSREGEAYDNDHIIESENVMSKRHQIRCRRSLGNVVLGYFVVVHVAGAAAVLTYVTVVPSARRVLEAKSIALQTFAVMLVVSTFSNCGYVPTNENMVVFLRNSGLLLFISPLVLLGNTLYPAALRLLLHGLDKITRRSDIRILTHYNELGYPHLLPPRRTWMLAATALGFLAVQLFLLCAMEWSSGALAALPSLTPYQKLVASFFQVINSRHAGESVLDLSTISSVVLVLFIVMMYLPPYTTWSPWKEEDGEKEKKMVAGNYSLAECLLLPQLAYLAVFIILVCITERHKLRDDPLNFNPLTITVEIVSAFGNVGFSTCYSCKRQLKGESGCQDTWAGFVGRWSTSGKLILIIVMLFGRLKKYTYKAGKAWH